MKERENHMEKATTKYTQLIPKCMKAVVEMGMKPIIPILDYEQIHD